MLGRQVGEEAVHLAGHGGKARDPELGALAQQCLDVGLVELWAGQLGEQLLAPLGHRAAHLLAAGHHLLAQRGQRLLLGRVEVEPVGQASNPLARVAGQALPGHIEVDRAGDEGQVDGQGDRQKDPGQLAAHGASFKSLNEVPAGLVEHQSGLLGDIVLDCQGAGIGALAELKGHATGHKQGRRGAAPGEWPPQGRHQAVPSGSRGSAVRQQRDGASHDPLGRRAVVLVQGRLDRRQPVERAGLGGQPRRHHLGRAFVEAALEIGREGHLVGRRRAAVKRDGLPVAVPMVPIHRFALLCVVLGHGLAPLDNTAAGDKESPLHLI